MTTLREAAEMALAALNSSRVFVTSREKIKHPEGTEWYDEAITTLRAALEASKEVEPVAWQHRQRGPNQTEWQEWHTVGYKPQGPESSRFQMRPLYTHPAPAVPEVEEGWQLVPKEPTEGMLNALGDRMWKSHTVYSVWEAMLAAAEREEYEKVAEQYTAEVFKRESDIERRRHPGQDY